MEQESKTKREVSDDDVSSDGEMKQPKSRSVTKSIHTKEDFIQTIAEALQEERIDEKKAVTEEDFIRTIDEALQEQRIDEKKAERLHECLQSGDWTYVAFSLLREQIPMKRKGNGYSCRVCQVPKKGHTCMYCHVCSTPEKKFKKDDEHVCMKCPMCFEEGKKKKKLVQVVCGGRECRHGPHESKHYIGV